MTKIFTQRPERPLCEHVWDNFKFAQAVTRERMVRTGAAEPRNQDERRQRAEGPRMDRDLDALRAR